MGTASEEKAQGVKCYRAGDYDGAIFHFSEALRHGPDDAAQVLGNRAAAFEKIGDYEAAIADARKAVMTSPEYLKGYFRLATALIETGRHAEAVTAADEGLRRQPRNSQLQELHDKAHALQNEKEDEVEEDDEEDDEEDVDELMMTNQSDVAIERPVSSRSSGAMPIEEERIHGTPEERGEAAKVAGNEQYRTGQYESAIRLYSQAISFVPRNATYFINRAAAALMVEKAEEALADCNTALSIEPSLIKAHVRAAKSQVQLGKLSDARRQLELGATFGKDAGLQTEMASLAQLEVWLRSAKGALSQGGGAAAREALRLFTNLAQRCPCSEAIACQRMEALLRARPDQGPAQVISESARWLRKSGDNPDLLCVRGKGLYSSGQVDSGLKHFAEALRLDPDHTASRKMRSKIKELEKAKEAGREAFQAGRFNEAAELYTQALAVDPENIEVAVTLYTNRATAHFKCSAYKQAVEDCKLALGVQPRHLKALLRRAACYIELEEWNKAIEDYEAAHSIDGDDQGIQNKLRQARFELKKAGRKDLYKLLGTTRTATDHDVRHLPASLPSLSPTPCH